MVAKPIHFFVRPPRSLSREATARCLLACSFGSPKLERRVGEKPCAKKKKKRAQTWTLLVGPRRFRKKMTRPLRTLVVLLVASFVALCGEGQGADASPDAGGNNTEHCFGVLIPCVSWQTNPT